jgi:hypothetical protein
MANVTNDVLVAKIEELSKRLEEVSAAAAAKGGGRPAADPVLLAQLRGSVRLGNGQPVSKLLQITSRLSRPDPLAAQALGQVEDEILKADPDVEKLLIRLVEDAGIATAVKRITSRVDGSALDETGRFLLSRSSLYASLLRGVLVRASDPKDPTKLEKFVADAGGVTSALLDLLNTDNKPRHKFAAALANAALQRSGVQLNPNSPTGKRLIAELRNHPAPLGMGRVEPAVEAAWESILKDGSVSSFVELFAQKQEIDPLSFTPAVKKTMTNFLVNRGLKIDIGNDNDLAKFHSGGFDEYFALAHDQALAAAAGEDDPVDGARTKGGNVSGWDFTVDTFETIEDQGIVKENILAAGALDYIFELGERLGAFRLADALTLNWAAGSIDVVDGPCAAKLYRYWKLRDQRSDPAERGLVYKRVLNKGDAEVLERMVANDPFPALWGELMEKVAEYIGKTEEAKAESGDTLLVSKNPIYQAIRNLQYNLTEFCTGMAHMQIREMYSQLREALDILGDPEIVDHFAGGRRKNMWTAIARLAKSEYGEAPNISAIRTAAVEGNAVYRFIANFQQGSDDDEAFRRFVEAAEAWIIAKGADDTELAPVMADDEAEWEDEDYGDFDE